MYLRFQWINIDEIPSPFARWAWRPWQIRTRMRREIWGRFPAADPMGWYGRCHDMQNLWVQILRYEKYETWNMWNMYECIWIYSLYHSRNISWKLIILEISPVLWCSKDAEMVSGWHCSTEAGDVQDELSGIDHPESHQLFRKEWAFLSPENWEVRFSG